MGSPEAGNTRLRSARQALGLRSQQQLADAVTRAGNSIGLRISITARTVRRWESDAPPWPHPDHQAAVEALFQRPIAELGFTPPWADAQTDTPHPERARSLPAVTASSAAGSLTMFPQRQPAAPLPGSVVSDYSPSPRPTGICTGSFRQPNCMTRSPRTSISARAWCRPFPKQRGVPLRQQSSESSLLAGRIEFFDLQNPAKAQASFVIALQAAQDAQDALLGSAVLAHMAFIPAFSGDAKRAEEARDKIRAARAFARRSTRVPGNAGLARCRRSGSRDPVREHP